ncbi:MAG: nuclear transport factor 2 family protein [Pseudomonadales bacterium]|nr:nuclear transport factor 2 family protein [Halioglobus sp.]MCP5123716.1 nuclear transport factor 2 family protein [Pseudomonadales bacterium]MCP5192037.1 nuclear transport factor 2 family protein [Pseudomonadales bacterium]
MSGAAEDELALARLMSRYVDAVHRRDASAWAATWSEDACWNLMGTQVSGKANIVALWQQVMAGFEFALMLPSSCLFSIDGDTASGHWYLQEHTRDREGLAGSSISRYLDTYSKRNGQWLYQSRHYGIIYHGAPDLSGSYTAPP